MTDKRYRWSHPLNWLEDFLTRVDAENRDSHCLLVEALNLAAQLDGDQIQDIYQSQMAADGYFDPVDDS